MKKVFVVATGGTIEKTYSELDGSLTNRETVVTKFIKQKLRLPYTDIEVRAIMAKDSLYMDQGDREYICYYLADLVSKSSPIVVLHGTDTLEKTARFCFENMKTPTVPIVFTGAMKPFGFEDSDALQNVTEALMISKILEPGLYVSFHGEVFQIPNVQKNKELLTFEKKTEH